MKLESVASPITIGSANIDLGESLRTYAEQEILKVAAKYFGRLTVGSAHFNKEGVDYRCSVNMQMGALPMMTGEATAKDIRLAFDTALDKLAKQLRRTKRELRDDKNG
jgi:ribosomal subunit interface protein